MRIAPDFRAVLAGHDLDALDAWPGVIIGVRRDNTIAYCNAAWDAFAIANGGEALLDGWGPPRTVLDAFSLPLRPYYAALFERVRQSGTPTGHEYDCSSATQERRHRLRVFPLAAGALLLRHEALVDRPHAVLGPAGPGVEAAYRADTGLITLCAACNSVRNPANPAAWDWVPALIQPRLAGVSHGLCPVCFAHLYPED
jgi:hypothetical protein